MEITFGDIKPYLRFVRYMNLDPSSSYAPSVPYDARLFYALSGESVIEASGKKYPMKRGSLLFINSGIDYHVLAPDCTVTYLAINFDYTYSAFRQSVPVLPAAIDSFDSQKLVSHVKFSDAKAFNEVFYLPSFPAAEAKLIAMEKEFSQRIHMHELRLSALMTDLLVHCFRHHALGGAANAEQETANSILAYIQQNLHRPLSNAEIAQHFHYHPNHISTLIKQYTGDPLHQYIKSIRTAKAAHLLATTDLLLCDIAVSCGFYDTSHFVRCFKQEMQLTPRQYRSNFQ